MKLVKKQQGGNQQHSGSPLVAGTMDRRTFLKRSGITVGGVAAGSQGPRPAYGHEYRTHLSSSSGEGGLPYMRTPTRKILAAIQTMPTMQP